MTNKFFNARNIAIAVLTLALGSFVAVGAARLFFGTTETISGNITSFILNREGRVDGAILDTGDQIKFGAEAGDVVTANAQPGTPLTATGRAGKRSNYGREFHASSLQLGEQTITIASGRPKGPKGPKEPKDGRPHRPHPPKDGDRGPRGSKDDENERPLPPDEAEIADANADKPSPVETANVSGSVKFVLVNKDGEPRGLILAGGEQFALGKEVEDADLSFDENTSVGATGEIVKTPFGTVLRPKVLTVGQQTFTFDR